MKGQLPKANPLVALPFVVAAWLVCDPDQPLEDIKGIRRWIALGLMFIARIFM